MNGAAGVQWGHYGAHWYQIGEQAPSDNIDAILAGGILAGGIIVILFLFWRDRGK